MINLLLTSAAGLALTQGAQAQSAGESGADAVMAGGAGQQDGESNEDAIVVTGSRIQRDGYSQPTPVTTSTVEALQSAAPSTVADALVQLPQFAGSVGRGACCSAGSGGAFLNLRGLGADRNLILLDSNRITPTSGSTVDVNLLPELLLQRVDVVTGGASAAYGSDAISGAVNYITDTKFAGVKLVAQNGISTYGDDSSHKLGAAIGANFAGGRGHISLSFEHFSTGGIRSNRDRPFSRNPAYLTGFSDSSSPFRTLTGIRQNTVTNGGVIVSPSTGALPIATPDSPLAGLRFLPGGAVTLYDFGEPVDGFASVSRGGDGFIYDENTPLGSLLTNKVFGRVDYELLDELSAHVRFAGAKTRSITSIYSNDFSGGNVFTIYRDNAYLSPAVTNLMDANGVSSFQLGRYLRETGAITNNNNLRFFDINAGLDGKIGPGWTWSANYSHGESRVIYRVENNPIFGNIYAAADAVRDPSSGQIVCRVTLTNPTAYPGCVPVNLFGEGSVSNAARDYISGTSVGVTTNKQDIFTLNAQGTVVMLPAGPLDVAVGGEYRRRLVRSTSNPIALTQINATGVQGIPTTICPTTGTCQVGGFSTGNFGETAARDDIRELFAEVNVPIFKDAPFVRSLELNGAYRYTHYKYSGGASTWKVGINYQPFEELRFRATRSRDIRAPNLEDLFSGDQAGFAPGLSDAQTGQTNLYVTTVTRGNPNLQPEVGNTFTVGAIYSPGFIPGLKGSIDYYHIRLNGALSLADAQRLLDDCANGDTVSCGLIARDSAGNISQITIQRINLASRKTSGIDFDLSYTRPLGDGNMSLRLLASHLIKFEDTSGGLVTERAGLQDASFGRPKWRGNLQLSYDADIWGVFVQERYIGSLDQYQFAGAVFAEPKIKAVAYTDITTTFKIGDKKRFELYGTVNNLFNKQPPIIANFFGAGLGSPTLAGLYDIEGRYFTAGVRLRF